MSAEYANTIFVRGRTRSNRRYIVSLVPAVSSKPNSCSLALSMYSNRCSAPPGGCSFLNACNLPHYNFWPLYMTHLPNVTIGDASDAKPKFRDIAPIAHLFFAPLRYTKCPHSQLLRDVIRVLSNCM